MYVYIYICMCIYIYMQAHKKVLEVRTVNCGYSGEVHGNLVAY